MPTSGQLNVVDLFAGCGALSTGFSNAANGIYDVVLANEINPQAARAYTLNHPKAEMLVGDVRRLTRKKIQDTVGMKGREIDIVIGGPPCQGFSAAGNRSCDDPRNGYFAEFVRLVGELSPTISVLENVPQFLSSLNGAYERMLSRMMDKQGYVTKTAILLASDYGIPQVRKRAICISVKRNCKEEITFPAPTHEKVVNAHLLQKGSRRGIEEQRWPPLEKFVSVEDAIGDLPSLDPDNVAGREYAEKPSSAYQKARRKRSRKVSHHEYWNHTTPLLEYIAEIPEGGRMVETYPIHMWKGKGFGQAYGRLHRSGVAQTITTSFHNPGSGRFIHYRDMRAISVREAARIQGFNDDFVFYGTKGQQEMQVGNAVPPLLAQKIGEHIYTTIFLKRSEPSLNPSGELKLGGQDLVLQAGLPQTLSE